MNNNDRCIKHRKNYEGVCNWCGTKCCQLCIAGRRGNKIYCESCGQRLGPIKPDKQLPTLDTPNERKISSEDKIEAYY